MALELQPVLSAWICAVFAFGATIFFVLLAIERPVWEVTRGCAAASIPENALRRVHATLRTLIPILPPANGLVVLGGSALLIG